MKIATYNVNGIRAALTKDFFSWLKATNPDVLCLQEIKAFPEQANPHLFESLGYHTYWYPAQKPGYSGVAIFSKQKPKHIEYGCGIEKYDKEGRVLRADFDKISIMSAYLPSGSSGEDRQSFKMTFLDDFYSYIGDLKSNIESLGICGDFNICHHPIDIHNPKSNANSSGFLPEEREWMSKFTEGLDFIDSFRHVNKEPHNYTWWSYRANARAKNLGWRIDYIFFSKNLENFIKRSNILSEAKHSDHCPVISELEIL
jgi:exodeoxyribonuclease III